MSNLIKFALAILAVTALVAGSAQAKQAETVEKFIEDLRGVVTGPQPFMHFSRVVDPLKQHQSTMDDIRQVLRNEFRGEEAKLDVLYRNDDSDVAVTIITALWVDTKYAYMAFVLHKRPDGWLPISFSMQSSYEKILRYR